MDGIDGENIMIFTCVCVCIFVCICHEVMCDTTSGVLMFEA
jgi:hypothetical protein